MSIRIGNRAFAPGVAGTVATIVLLPCLISLGAWQLRRADEKRAVEAAYRHGGDHVVDAVTADGIDALPRYQHIEVRGHYAAGRQILLDNMPSQNGRPGYQVLTPLVLDGGGLLLVNRGWVPLGATRDVLPDVQVDADMRTVVGRVDELPEPGLRIGDDVPLALSDWPLVLNFPTHAQLGTVYGDELCRYQLLLDPAADDGYERAWHARFGFGPERHVGYAVQWFALAAALVAIYIGVNLKTSRQGEGQREEAGRE